MSLRPRYSLLTLLILTALVAGGMKLWRGPHRHLEQWCENVQCEYFCLRDWQGNEYLDGVRITRSHSLERQVVEYDRFELEYVRNFKFVPWRYIYYVLPADKEPDFPLVQQSDAESPLSVEELREVRAVIEREKQRLPQRGSGFKAFEYLGPPLDSDNEVLP